MVDRSLVAAAACFLGATAFGALVSVEEDIPGEPLRLRAPGPVAIQLAAGLGNGVSAPGGAGDVGTATTLIAGQSRHRPEPGRGRRPDLRGVAC